MALHGSSRPLPREDRGGASGGPVGAGGPDVLPGAADAPPPGERPKLKLKARSKPLGEAAPDSGGATSSKSASIFGGGKAHDEFAYEVRAPYTTGSAMQ